MDSRAEAYYVRRHLHNPIIRAEDMPFRAQCVFNSGATLFDGKVCMVLNAWDATWSPRFLVAHSVDGVRFTIEPENIIPPMPEYYFWQQGGMFDTRITRLEGSYYVTFNSYAAEAGGRIRMLKTDDFRHFEDMGFITSSDHRNCVLFPEKIDGSYVRLERPNGQEKLGEIFISYSPDLVHWGRAELLLNKGVQYWESKKVGPGAPPVKTEQGWLVIYHGCREHMNGITYNVGCMLLDLADPSRIIGKMKECLMWPQEPYELCGNVPQVVFPTAAVAHGQPDELKIYYGAADKCMALAQASVSVLVEKCLEDGPLAYEFIG